MPEGVLTEDDFTQAFEAAASRSDNRGGEQVVEIPVLEDIQPAEEAFEEKIAEAIEGASAAEETEDKLVEETAPEVTERVVEKIVEIEKYPEFKDESSKALFEAFVNGKEDEVYQYLQQKNKDYKTMSDADVIREHIKAKNPDWTNQEVELDLRDLYGEDLEKVDLTDLFDDQEIAEAKKFNNRVERNLVKLERVARDARHELIKNQKNIELPKIAQSTQAETLAEPSEEEKANLQKEWVQKVSTEVPKLQDLVFKVDDKEVIYKQTDAGKKELAERIKNFNVEKFIAERWYNEDGTSNVVKLAKDMQLLYDSEKIFKSFATQIKALSTKEVIKDIKNYDTDKRSSSQPIAADNFEDLYFKTKS